MELEIATTRDMIGELCRRNVSFVLVSVENTNGKEQPHAHLAGNARSSLDMLWLCRLGAKMLRKVHHTEKLPKPE